MILNATGWLQDMTKYVSGDKLIPGFVLKREVTLEISESDLGKKQFSFRIMFSGPVEHSFITLSNHFELPFHPQHVKALIDACSNNDVPLIVKQYARFPALEELL